MTVVINSIATPLLLALVLSLDAFVASFAYGTKRIFIPISSVIVLNIVCGLTLCFSLLLGSWVGDYFPQEWTTWICFFILFLLGLIKLLDSLIKSIICRYNNGLSKQLSFSFFQLKFILNLYVDPIQADVDESKVISPIESLSLGLALSLDGLAVGFGAAIGDISPLLLFGCSIVVNTIAIVLGCVLGHQLACKLPFNFSWISGALLIILALCRF